MAGRDFKAWDGVMSIIVGDIHGNVEKVRAFLEYKPDAEHVAVGDYLDSFTEPVGRQIEALQLLLDSKAVLLWGNHDLHYLQNPLFQFPGFNAGHAQEFQEILEANIQRFKPAYVVDGWLCTHSGVHRILAKNRTVWDMACVGAVRVCSGCLNLAGASSGTA